jgi:hypothetical protein
VPSGRRYLGGDAREEVLQPAIVVLPRRLQDFFARVAAEMSAAGRQKLADWRSGRPSPAAKGEAR